MENALDVKYLQFGREISSLGKSLKGLERIINNAEGQRPPRRPWHSDADHFGGALETLPEVTGDFSRTLKDCETLLSDHSQFHRSPAGFIDNIVWWSGTEGAVNNLRERVHFHVTKLSFVLKPFEIQLLLGIKRELQQLRVDVAELRGVVVQGIIQSRDPTWTPPPPSYSIPEDLVSRFATALEFNKPVSFRASADWPLKEGFDALVFNFAHSTVEFNPLHQLTPEEPQFLNLLKSKWIMQKIKESPRFQSTGPESLWADYMRELEGDIRGQFKRFDAGYLVTPDLSIVSRLPDECFSIWIIENASLLPPNLAEQRSLEDKILELALPWSFGTRYETLTVFRVSDVDLRLVKTTKDEQNPFLHLEDSTELSMNSSRLIPIYANPGEGSSANNNILICNGQGQKPKSHALKNSKDVEKFQQALTGYRVSHQMSNFSWCINGSPAPGDSGKGILQLWHLKPLPKLIPEGEAASPKQSDSSVASPRSQAGRNPLRQSTQSITSAELNAIQVPMPDLASSPVENGRPVANRLSSATTQVDPRSPTLERFATGLSAQTERNQATGSCLTRHSTGMSSTTLVSRSSIASPVNGLHGEGTALFRPEPPVMVIFTMCGGKHTFLHITSEHR